MNRYTAILGAGALALALAGCAGAGDQSAPTATVAQPTPSTQSYEPFCDVYDQNSDAYYEAVDSGDSEALYALRTWADDIEHNIAPGYSTVAANFTSAIRQVEAAKNGTSSTVSIDLVGFKAGYATFELACIGESMRPLLDHDSDAVFTR